MTWSSDLDDTCRIEPDIGAVAPDGAITISPAATATLSWSVTGADMVSIDAAIGAVAAEGSAAVTPEVTTTYTLTAAGPGGTATAATTVSVATPITIMVVAPSAGDVIDRTDTLVRGIFTNSSGAETVLLTSITTQ